MSPASAELYHAIVKELDLGNGHARNLTRIVQRQCASHMPMCYAYVILKQCHREWNFTLSKTGRELVIYRKDYAYHEK